MSDFKVGFSTVNVNPPLGIGIAGYFIPRYAKGFLDDLDLRTLALSLGDKQIVMISIPNCNNFFADKCAEAIEKATGLSRDNLFIAATHTHTGPRTKPSAETTEEDLVLINKYLDFLIERMIDATKLALADLRPAKMGYIYGWAPERVAYIRRYKMKDGSTMTCPPINDPNIDHPIGTLDQRVNVLRFDREGAESIVLVNYGLHADTTNGELISADWPGWMYSTIEKALDGTKCIFFPGAEGDVGSTNVHVKPSDGDMNDTEISFDNEMKSPGMARFVGRAIAGTVLQVFDKVQYIDVDKINIIRHDVSVLSNRPEPEELPLAHKYKELHEAGRDDLIPYSAMELTTVVAEALRMCRLEDAPREFVLNLTGLQIGEVALVGIPGEPFTDIGVGIKKAEGWSLILPCALTNGAFGYFPMKSAYDEGGYEARSSNYKSGVAERIIEGGIEVLNKLKN